MKQKSPLPSATVALAKVCQQYIKTNVTLPVMEASLDDAGLPSALAEFHRLGYVYLLDGIQAISEIRSDEDSKTAKTTSLSIAQRNQRNAFLKFFKILQLFVPSLYPIEAAAM